jgi:L-aspartate oxidase
VGASLTRVVAALPLPAAGWVRSTDVVVVGTGAAGLMTALALADAGRAVTVVTKGALGDGSTCWAQGGLAAVLGPDDDADLHARDTLVAGAGLCDEAAVRTLVDEAPDAVAHLRALGARLDLAPDGRPALTREGGHSRDRIVHAGGDASGAEVTRTLAAALRAGAEIADVEMVQFHPTVLWTGRGAAGQQVLVSEAVRGEGAVLVDRSGRRIMVGAHPLADLAPRDVVSATIAAHLRATGEDCVLLDATHLGAEFLRRRFPGIVRACRAAGFDLTREPVPVRPAAHYACGGVVADLDGRTTVPGLFAVGEVACTGVQGANRLASNSITEGLVAARRCAALLAADLPAVGEPVEPMAGTAIDGGARPAITAATTRHAGVLRDGDGLTRLGRVLAGAGHHEGALDVASVEATALHTVATLLAGAAAARTESRGCHRRADLPETRPEWEVRLVHRLDRAGHLHVRTEPVRTLVGAQVVA